MILYDICKGANPNSHLVSGPGDIDPEWFADAESVGISGATSTPMWLMEEIVVKIREING
jgi:4-hydroxy-3-methylbut-2-enyl diphosphate reductase